MNRRTKIVCTLGPVSWSPERVAALIAAGMDVARINFSHGTQERHAETIRNVREAARAAGKPIAILGDLQGPKIRVGVLPEGGVELHPGDAVTFAPEGEHQGAELPTTYADLAGDVDVGDVVLLADGLMELIVEETAGSRVTMRVIHGGTLTSNKGINLPGVRVSAPSLTEKDLRDLEFALDQQLDYVALSFVRSAEDVLDLVRRIPEDGPLIVVKVEKGHALENLEAILSASAAAMVARGDLGVELPFEKVPLAQKRMIQMANLSARPVITATQMLESMIENPRPTRAEASDVANAIIDGTDAVMLSAETATGKFPVQAVQSMVRIAQEIEDSHVLDAGPHYDMPITISSDGHTPTERAVAGATVEAVRRLQAPVIVTFTSSGSTARVVSSFRPPVPILAITDTERTYNQLALVWGTIPVLCSADTTFEEMMAYARSEVIARGLGSPGDRMVVTAGYPIHVPGTTNLLQVEVV
ncbi:MAG TPA: pyruvate kinase [Longimicrobium sp.]|jgi:pyruvate kinase